jgi:hypothetical protein
MSISPSQVGARWSGAFLITLLGVAACSPAAVPSSETPGQSASPSASAGATTFTSNIYGYSASIPAGWISVPATEQWDGTASPGNDDPVNDQWSSPGTASAWGRAAPFSGNLAVYTKDAVATNAKYHGDTCPPTPASQDSIMIGAERGTLLAWNCGILINVGVTVHKGVAYFFGFRDPGVNASTDPTDRATFTALLESVQFPK